MALNNIRLEVMQTVEKSVQGFIDQYLIPVEEIWQPTDMLPNLQDDKGFEEVHHFVQVRRGERRRLLRE